MAARVKWLPSVQRRFWRRFCTETPAAFLSRRCDSTAFGICECANPFQVFILPRLFKFSVLIFFNQNFRSHIASICRKLRTVDVRGVPFIPKIEIKKRRISPLDGETRRALMYLIFRILARGERKFYRAFPGSPAYMSSPALRHAQGRLRRGSPMSNLAGSGYIARRPVRAYGTPAPLLQRSRASASPPQGVTYRTLGSLLP